MRKLTAITFAAVTTIITAGCASGPALPKQSFNRTQAVFANVNTPNLGVTTTAELGQTLISRSSSRTTPAIRLFEPQAFPTQNNGVQFNVAVPGGVLKKVGENAEGEFFQAPGMELSVSSIGIVNRKAVDGGLMLPQHRTSPVTVYWIALDNSGQAVLHPIDAKVERLPDIVEVSSDNFRRELIYTGVSKNVITIVYREFVNDLARPAFMQELKYDLGEGTTIGFKGARFEVIKATNTGITYKVLRPLD